MLERHAELRDDEAALAALAARPDALIVTLAGTRNLFEVGQPRPLLVTRAVAPALLEAAATRVFLGFDAGVPVFAALHADEPAAPGRFLDLRGLLPTLEDADLDLLLLGRAFAHWHAHHRHCGACGAPTRAFRGGHARTCAACSLEVFPRLDPAIIVLVADDTRCLLGRGAQWPAGRFSTLAGFVEPGETLEEAVAREVREESGVVVGAPRYIASQAWPFPSSLMLGFEAEPHSTAITVDDTELAEARWFTRADLGAGLAAGTLSLSTPRSIAFRLLARWHDREAAVPLRNLIVT